jgi:hypothetical protein
VKVPVITKEPLEIGAATVGEETMRPSTMMAI